MASFHVKRALEVYVILLLLSIVVKKRLKSAALLIGPASSPALGVGKENKKMTKDQNILDNTEKCSYFLYERFTVCKLD